MLNPNIEMLENLISAAVSTRYKEVPPTEEEFLTLAQSMRATLSTLPVTDEEFAEILVRLRASIVIQMDVGVYINDRNTPHKSWLPSRRADLDFFFWNRYKKYLEEIKHWNPRVTATLDKVSDEIVDLLGDPQSKEPFQRRGLVLGDVQSGKTANYTAISNKAADTGYRIIIVLAGMMENLRQQTQSRLDAEFSGRKSEYYLDPKAEQGIKNQPVGVGRYGVQKRIAAFTSVTKDFDINVLKSNDLNLQSVSDPIVLVVKKNKRILNNLIKWLSNSRDNTTGKIMLPMLLIDDEADNASVNTKSEDDSPAAINACIRQLLHEFSLLIHSTYAWSSIPGEFLLLQNLVRSMKQNGFMSVPRANFCRLRCALHRPRSGNSCCKIPRAKSSLKRIWLKYATRGVKCPTSSARVLRQTL